MVRSYYTAKCFHSAWATGEITAIMIIARRV